MHALQTLDLSNNAITEWAAIRPLSWLPSLQSLSVSDNQIVAIMASTAPGAAAAAPSMGGMDKISF